MVLDSYRQTLFFMIHIQDLTSRKLKVINNYILGLYGVRLEHILLVYEVIRILTID